MGPSYPEWVMKNVNIVSGSHEMKKLRQFLYDLEAHELGRDAARESGIFVSLPEDQPLQRTAFPAAAASVQD